LQRTPNEVIERWDITGLSKWLETHHESLLNDMNRMADYVEDRRIREFMKKASELIVVNQSLVMLQLLRFKMQMKEQTLAVDQELFEISESVAEILSVHLKEAENLRKIV
jgi:hypothetical protein